VSTEFTKTIEKYYIYNKLYWKIYEFHVEIDEFKEKYYFQKYSNNEDIEEFKDIDKLILVADELFGAVREQAYKELCSTVKSFTQAMKIFKKNF
jgi:hypothetical protein